MRSASDTESDPLKIVFTGGVVSALSATALTSLLSTVFFAVPNSKSMSFGHVVREFLAICLFAAVPAGSFGFIAGMAGAAWLNYRRSRFHSVGRLLSESIVVGGVLALVFPAFRSAMGWTISPGLANVIDPRALLFCLGVGCGSAAIFALAFRRYFLQPRSVDR